MLILLEFYSSEQIPVT